MLTFLKALIKKNFDSVKKLGYIAEKPIFIINLLNSLRFFDYESQIFLVKLILNLFCHKKG
jgi:hypothetical protein